MKVVKRFENGFSANLTKGMLENHGIDAWVLNPHQAFSTGSTFGTLGIELAVADEDYDEACRLLAASSNAE